jgi:hypothetical protein
VFSGEGSLTGVAVPGNRLSSCGRMLAGAECVRGGCPPTNEGSSEVRLFVRSPAPAKGVPAGDQVGARSSPVNGLSPELRLPVIVPPPAGECWPELDAGVKAVLPRTRARRSW